MSSTMVAAQLVEPCRFELVEVSRPSPRRGEVRVAVEGCGVCASNLPAWSGRPWFSYPLAPGELGHEGWGVVEALGAGVDEAWLGRRVAMVSERSYAESEVVPLEDLIALPASATGVAPLEPFGCVFNIVDRTAIEPNSWIAVLGLGFIGLGVVRLALRAGARVIAVSSNPAALKSARDFGVTEYWSSESWSGEDAAEVRQRVEGLTRGTGCARVIECTGHQAPLDLAGDIVAHGGRLVIAGFHQDGPRQVDLQQWNWKGIDVVNAHERSRERVRGGMRKAALAIAEDPLWTANLITHRFPLNDIDSALESASRRVPGFVKAAVLMVPESTSQQTAAQDTVQAESGAVEAMAGQPDSLENR